MPRKSKERSGSSSSSSSSSSGVASFPSPAAVSSSPSSSSSSPSSRPRTPRKKKAPIDNEDSQELVLDESEKQSKSFVTLTKSDGEDHEDEAEKGKRGKKAKKGKRENRLHDSIVKKGNKHSLADDDDDKEEEEEYVQQQQEEEEQEEEEETEETGLGDSELEKTGGRLVRKINNTQEKQVVSSAGVKGWLGPGTFHPGVGVFSRDSRFVYWSFGGAHPGSSSQASKQSSVGCIGQYLVDAGTSNEGSLVRVLRGHRARVTQLLLHPNNSLQLVSASLDQTIRIWDTLDCECLQTIPVNKRIHHLQIAKNSPNTFYLVYSDLPSPAASHGQTKGTPHNRQRRTMYKIGVLKYTPATLANPTPTTSFVVLGASPVRPVGLLLTSNDSLLLAAVNRQVWMWDLFNDVFYRFHHSYPITSFALHPFDSCFVIGDSNGSITSFFYTKNARNYHHNSSLFSTSSSTSSSSTSSSSSSTSSSTSSTSSSTTSTSSLRIWTDCPKAHLTWHPHEVTTLAFTADGAYLLSGGHEGVLVIWQLRNGVPDFLPRLGDEIASIVVSSNASQYTVSLKRSNCLLLVDAATMKIHARIQGLQLPSSSKQAKFAVGLVPSPLNSSQQIVTNGVPGSLQWYDFTRGRSDRVLEVSYNTHVASNTMLELTECDVQLVAFSPDGQWLVTADFRRDAVGSDHSSALKEACLCFWRYEAEHSTYLLNTCVRDPHQKGRRVTSICFHPADDLVVTCGADSSFRFWTVVSRPRPQLSTAAQRVAQPVAVEADMWVCRSIGEYTAFSVATDCSFSSDGTILAVTYGNTITLWDPYLNVLLRTLCYPHSDKPVRFAKFLNPPAREEEDVSPYLVAATTNMLIVWDLLSCEVHWQAQLDSISQLAVSPSDSYFAVATSLSRDFDSVPTVVCLFSPHRPVPVQVWRHSSGIHGMCFTGQQLTILDRNLAFFSVPSEAVPVAPPADEEPVSLPVQLPSKAEQNLAIFGLSDSTDAAGLKDDGEQQEEDDEEEQDERNRQRGLLSSTAIADNKAIFDAPSHILPSMSALYSSFIDSLLFKKVPSAEEQSAQSTSESSEQQEQPQQIALDDDLNPIPDFEHLRIACSESSEAPQYRALGSFFTSFFSASPSSSSSSSSSSPSSSSSSSQSSKEVQTPSKESTTKTPSRTPSKEAKTPSKEAKTPSTESTTKTPSKEAKTPPTEPTTKTPSKVVKTPSKEVKKESRSKTPSKENTETKTPAKEAQKTPQKKTAADSPEVTKSKQKSSSTPKSLRPRQKA